MAILSSFLKTSSMFALEFVKLVSDLMIYLGIIIPQRVQVYLVWHNNNPEGTHLFCVMSSMITIK